jgi:serine/threonine protein kinase
MDPKDLTCSSCVISDFGSATFQCSTISRTTSNSSDSIQSTLQYTAPELLSNPSVKKHRSLDIYSLGILLGEVFSGKAPYDNSWKNDLASL